MEHGIKVKRELDLEEIEQEHWNDNLELIRQLTLENKALKAKIAEVHKILKDPLFPQYFRRRLLECLAGENTKP